ncbi:hypothetical protein AAC387_Pa07g0167 [Persea americana]
MHPNFDFESYGLFCSEDNNSIMGFGEDDDDDVVVVVAAEEQRYYQPGQSQSHGCSQDFLMEFPVTDVSLGEMVENECHNMPREDYKRRLESGVLDSSLRTFAVDWIGKAHAHYDFGPLTAYRSINYFDRFLSSYELPEGKPWMIQLVILACLFIAAKVEETTVPRFLDLQAAIGNLHFKARAIHKMELLILTKLKWRMQPITPFSLLHYFLQKVNNNSPPLQSSIYRSVEVVLRASRGIEFLEFRPSELASAVAISVTKESETVDFENAVSHCLFVDKARVFECFELIQKMGLISRSRPFQSVSWSSSLVSNSPIGVLDASWSTRTGETSIEAWEDSKESPTPPAAKRLKLD